MSEKKYVVYNPHIPGFLKTNDVDDWPAREAGEGEVGTFVPSFVERVRRFYVSDITKAFMFDIREARSLIAQGEEVLDYYQAVLTVPGVIEQLSETDP